MKLLRDGNLAISFTGFSIIFFLSELVKCLSLKTLPSIWTQLYEKLPLALDVFSSFHQSLLVVRKCTWLSINSSDQKVNLYFTKGIVKAKSTFAYCKMSLEDSDWSNSVQFQRCKCFKHTSGNALDQQIKEVSLQSEGSIPARPRLIFGLWEQSETYCTT